MADNFLTILEKERPQILKMLPSAGDRDKERWWALAYEMLRRPSLREVAEKNPTSLLNAIKKFADWGLIPDGEEGFIDVRNNKQEDGSYLLEAIPQPMYKGLIQRGVEAGIIVHAVGDLIKQGDVVEQRTSAKGRELRVTLGFGTPNRKIIGAYALFWLPGGLVDYELMDSTDLDRVKAAAAANRHGKDSPAWSSTPGEMYKKSAIKRGMKRMRGRRDTDAGRRFMQIMEDEDKRDKHFDAETSAAEVSDNIPTAIEDPAPAKSAVLVKPDSPAGTLTDDQQNGVLALKTRLHIPMPRFNQILQETAQVDDVALMPVSKLESLLDALNDAAA